MTRNRPRLLLLHIAAIAIALALACASRAQAADPPQVAWADQLVATLATPTPTNVYGAPVDVRWAGADGASASFNRSRCASFVSALLKRSYGWSDTDFESWFGSSSPTSARYFERLAAGAAPNFGLVKRVDELVPGDVIVVVYPEGAEGPTTDSGHTMMVRSAPIAVPAISSPVGGAQFAVDVIDSSKSPHGAGDTRLYSGDQEQQGVGRGTIRLFANADGSFGGYAWTLSNGSRVHPAAEHPLLAARVIPPAPSEAPSGGKPPVAERPPANTNTGGAVLPAHRPLLRVVSARRFHRRVTVRLRCTGGAGVCHEQIRAMRGSAKSGRRALTRRRSVRVKSTRSVTLSLALSKRTIRALGRRHLRALTIELKPVARNSRTRFVVLKLARGHRR